MLRFRRRRKRPVFAAGGIVREPITVHVHIDEAMLDAKTIAAAIQRELLAVRHRNGNVLGLQ